MYFFFADGPQMLEAIVKLTPMDPAYMRHLLEKFDQVSRAVVLATLLGALGQGVLAGIAYTALGMPHLFLLTAVTALMALVPFVGAAAIWVPAALWLYFFAPFKIDADTIGYGRPAAAIFLAIWGALVIGMADNLIKPYVLRGQSNIHPLLALLSVIGGVQALGPIGIFVGPMVVAFLHALLTLLRGELKPEEESNQPVPVLPT
jgi:predicted PurR-regulated permease PerM